MNLRLVTPPAEEPVTLAQAKLHLRIITSLDQTEPSEDDAYVSALITAARQAAENYLNRPIALATYELRGDAFDVTLPVSPVAAVASVTFVDAAGAVQTVDPAGYELAGTVDAPVLRVAYGGSWPSGVRGQDDDVRVRFTAGWATADLLKPIYQAILLLIGHLYENREDTTALNLSELPMGSRYLLTPYRIWMGV
jgi:uncharacterized phiE125 gp8 family phage protein